MSAIVFFSSLHSLTQTCIYHSIVTDPQITGIHQQQRKQNTAIWDQKTFTQRQSEIKIKLSSHAAAISIVGFQMFIQIWSFTCCIFPIFFFTFLYTFLLCYNIFIMEFIDVLRKQVHCCLIWFIHFEPSFFVLHLLQPM